ncbi:hypothetical protein [Mycobacterium sp. 1274756.6]|uniref:hypothetical protein n=1 Tax=Mycobacterium sp. 1274756.6 TaxID=1834076 RepID=UPI000A4FF58E|nr:hypothetical protein [Mycobacterium sp. 1274756.6]
MTRSRGWAGAAAVFAGAVGLTLAGAAPAQAADPIQGIYTYTEEGAPDAMWRVYPTCTPMGCSLNASMVVPNTADEKAGQFRLTNNLWTTSFPSPRGLTCPDGSTAEVQHTYSFDSATLAGTHTRSNAEVCGGKVAPALTKTPFTLTFQRPLDIPVNEHPLHCNDPWHCSA